MPSSPYVSLWRFLLANEAENSKSRPVLTSHNLWQTKFCMLLAVTSLMLASGSARAQATAERPWSKGISQEQQNKAEALYQEGNREFANGFFTAAATKYQAALQHWKHPGIHYNLALSLISLDRPLEAYKSIVAALRYGPDALHPEEYRRALDYQRLLRRQIAEVEVVCQEPGAEVTLDGKPLFTGPGQITTLVLPGKHQIDASKAGHLTMTKAFTLTGGGRTQVQLRLVATYRPTTHTQQRWHAWIPLTVTGLGLGAGVAAATLHWQFDRDADELGDSLRRQCSNGCLAYPEALIPLRERVEWQRKVASAGYATAGAFLGIGAVLAYLDRPQAVETGVHRETAQLSLSGGPAGSSGISVLVPF